MADAKVQKVRSALKQAEAWLVSQQSLQPDRPPVPLWKVLEIVRDALEQLPQSGGRF